MDRAIPKTTAPRKIPWGVVVIVIIVLIVLIIASLVVIMSEIDRRKQRGVRCPAAEYYRRNSWLLAPYNVWAASNSAAEPRPWMDMESMFPNGLVLQAGPLARTADRFAAPCGTTWASMCQRPFMTDAPTAAAGTLHTQQVSDVTPAVANGPTQARPETLRATWTRSKPIHAASLRMGKRTGGATASTSSLMTPTCMTCATCPTSRAWCCFAMWSGPDGLGAAIQQVGVHDVWPAVEQGQRSN